MGLLLKSNGIYTGPELAPGLDTYKERVVADGGEILSEGSTIAALLFAKSVGLSADNILSATSAGWGIKRVDGNVVKMYSLFGENGDLVVTSGVYPLTYTDGLPAIFCERDSANIIRSVGTFPPSPLDLVVKAKLTAVGVTQTIAAFWDENVQTSPAGRMLQLGATDELIYAYCINSGAVATTPYTPWGGEAASIGEGVLKVFARGEILASDPQVTPPGVTTRLYLGRSNSTLATGLMQGYIAEAWAGKGLTMNQVSAISLRSSV